MPFTGEHISPVPCPHCGQEVLVEVWDSSDGAYTDYRCSCKNKECDYIRWEEGSDY